MRHLVCIPGGPNRGSCQLGSDNSASAAAEQRVEKQGSSRELPASLVPVA